LRRLEQAVNFLNLIANDPNVAPAFRRLFATPQTDVRDVAHEKAEARRFTGEPPSCFGPLSEERLERIRQIREEEHADQLADEHRAAIARGE
jgi:hypothetical protein